VSLLNDFVGTKLSPSNFATQIQILKKQPIQMQKPFLYETVATDLERAMTEGVYSVGEKLPSVRQICQKYQVNASTAVHALGLLEQRDWVQPRPRSGYFVLPRQPQRTLLPPLTHQDLKVYTVDVVHILQKLNQAHTQSKIMNLGTSVPDNHVIPHKKIARIVRQIAAHELEQSMSYDSLVGLLELRQAIAKHYSDSHLGLTSEQIIITNGCLEAINLCLRAVVKSGDTIAVTLPCYFGILRAIQELGLKVIELPRDTEGGFDIAQLEHLVVEKGIKAVLCLSNFNNPDGLSISDDNKQQMAALAERLQLPIIEDDIYTDLFFADKRPLSIKAFDKAGWVLLCSSFSKILAPGLRVGWVVGGRFQNKLENLKFTGNYAVPLFNQLIIKHLMTNNGLERHLKSMRQTLYTQYFQYRKAIESYFPNTVRISDPKGGFVFWVELPDQIDVLTLYNQALERGVVFSIGELFAPNRNYAQFIRLSFGKEWTKETEEGLKVLGTLIQGMWDVKCSNL
jgi:DNA-binding transcriptional MocR family regulator